MAAEGDGCEDLPLARLLRPFGVSLRAEAAGTAPVLGMKLGGGSGEAKVANVTTTVRRRRRGVSAGDVLIALDGLRISSAKGWRICLARRGAGDEVELHLFRRDELMSFRAVLAAPPAERQGSSWRRADSAAAKLQRGVGVMRRLAVREAQPRTAARCDGAGARPGAPAAAGRVQASGAASCAGNSFGCQ